MHLRILFVGSKRLASQDYKSNHDEKKVQAPRGNVSINLQVYILSEVAKQQQGKTATSERCFVFHVVAGPSKTHTCFLTCLPIITRTDVEHQE